jgi:hypothetical protein
MRAHQSTGHKISLQYTVYFWGSFLSVLARRIQVWMLVRSFLHAVPSKTEAFYHLGMSFSVACLYQSMSFVTIRHVTTVFTTRYCWISATNIFSLHLETTDNFPVANSSDVLIMNVSPFNYEIVSHVKFYSGTSTYNCTGAELLHIELPLVASHGWRPYRKR